MPKIKKSTLQKDHNKLLNQFAELVRNLKALDVIPQEVCPTYSPKTKQLDQSIFDGLNEKWKFAAVDGDGGAYLFSSRPVKDRDLEMYLWNIHHTQESLEIDGVFDSSDWQDSLIERETNELTGSELCEYLLSNNSRIVMCLVSDASDKVAIQNEILTVINGNSHNGFTTQGIATWNFAVPVNNMGEPLTAKDVGL